MSASNDENKQLVLKNHPEIEEVLYTESEVQARVQEIADIINERYAGKKLVVVGILKGAYMFMSDLVRRLNVDHHVDFMSLSSYGKSTVRGSVRIIMDCRQNVGGKDVLIVEDIVDSGYTLQFLQNLFRTRKPASLATAVFLRKPECLKVEVDADFVGFDVPNKWICGYGLDCREDFRSFPFIGTLKKEIYEANPKKE